MAYRVKGKFSLGGQGWPSVWWRMHVAAAKPHRLGFSKMSVSVGALLHGAALVAAHLTAKQWDSPMAKLGTYAAFTAGAGFACKLLHERVTRNEKKLLGKLEAVETMAL